MSKKDNKVDYTTINHNLLKRYSNGEIYLKKEIIEINIPLVKQIARHCCNQTNLPYDDLFQEGCIALIKAIDKYDITKEIKFSTYLFSCVSGKIKSYICNNRYKNVAPTYLADQISMYDYYKSCGFTEDEIRMKMGLNPYDFKNFKEKYIQIKKNKIYKLRRKGI